VGGIPLGSHIYPRHKAGVENKVADAHNRRVMILVAICTELTTFERLREEYELCPDFVKICVTLWGSSVREMDDFLLQDKYLFRFRKLCIPRMSLEGILS